MTKKNSGSKKIIEFDGNLVIGLFGQALRYDSNSLDFMSDNQTQY